MPAAIAADARIALLPFYAESTFALALQGGSGAAITSPAPDARLSPVWAVRGTLVAQDRVPGGLFGDDPQTCFYGWLLERTDAPGTFMAVVRGTEDLREWFLDAEIGELATHSVVGKVEAGFWSIYDSMRYRPLTGGDFPAAQGLAAAVGSGHLTITGHSLGSPLTAYLAFDTAAPGLLGSRVSAIMFASPRPGDSSFGAAFNFRVPSHRAYWWAHDLVPHVPFGFGYAAVPQSIELTPPAGLVVCRSPACAHHCLTYAGMLDPSVLREFKPAAEDARFMSCVSFADAPLAATG